MKANIKVEIIFREIKPMNIFSVYKEKPVVTLIIYIKYFSSIKKINPRF